MAPSAASSAPGVLASSSTFTTPTAPVSFRPSAKFAMFTQWLPRMVPT